MTPFVQPEYVTCPTGLLLPKDMAEQHCFPRRPTAVELFCGCGGFGLGFIEAGFEVVAASDYDCAAAVTYMVNMCRYGEFTIHFIEESDQERLEKYLSKACKKGSVSGGPLAARAGFLVSPSLCPA
jgi:DNA (cytosine-5)-methyltransferase 1